MLKPHPGFYNCVHEKKKKKFNLDSFALLAVCTNTKMISIMYIDRLICIFKSIYSCLAVKAAGESNSPRPRAQTAVKHS